ncbi:MAG: DNA-binding response regulator [Oscillospiraceae bacterium]|jgi:DNA-binding response OmpR family regulator|nr:MAG: DNA-binding response regulator [Oscillospiraceae bacterium]
MEDRILIADDDPSILMLISDVLTDAGMQVRTVASGEEALHAVGEETFSLIILDIMMKGISGLEVCAAIRDKVSCPILFLSAKDSAHDIIEGLGLGADDYITKPFAIDELVARIKAHLRRQARLGENTTGGDVLRIGEITLDRRQLTVTRGGVPVDLSTREFELLDYLMRNAGQTLSREKIFRDVWKTEFGDIGTVAINIKNLRSKIDPDWAYIKTVWGSGYQFVTRSGLNEEKQAGDA